jgi:hypothetical protein
MSERQILLLKKRKRKTEKVIKFVAEKIEKTDQIVIINFFIEGKQ